MRILLPGQVKTDNTQSCIRNAELVQTAAAAAFGKKFVLIVVYLLPEDRATNRWCP